MLFVIIICCVNVSWFPCSICIHGRNLSISSIELCPVQWPALASPGGSWSHRPWGALLGRRAFIKGHSWSSCRKWENDGKWWNMPLISREWQGTIQNGLVWTDIPGLLRGIWPTSSCVCEYCNQRWPVVKPCRRSCHVSTLLKRTRRTLPV